MTAEKLPPDGYELGPGWTLIMGISNWGCSWRWHHRSGIEDCNTVAVYGHSTKDRAHPDWMAGSCARHAESMGAIVRKAEPPGGWAKAQPGTLCQHRDKWPDGTVDCRATAFAFGRVRLGPNCEVTQHACAGHVAEMSAPIIRKAEAPTRLPPEVVAAIHASAKAPPEQPSGNAGQLPADAPAAPVGEPVARCACTLVEPCRDSCSCAQPFNSGGCDRCATYGSDEQQLAAAKRIAERDARIAALEAELAKARKSREEIAAIAVKQHAATVAGVQATKRVAELEAEVSHLKYTAATDLELMKTNAAVRERLGVELAARLVERDGWMEAAAKSESEKAALVSAAVQAERERCAATMDEWLANRLTLADCRQRVGDGTPIKNGDPAP